MLTIPARELRRMKAIEAISRALAYELGRERAPGEPPTSVEVCALLRDLDAAHRGRVPEVWLEHLKQLEHPPRLGRITALERRMSRLPVLIASHSGFSTSQQ